VELVGTQHGYVPLHVPRPPRLTMAPWRRRGKAGRALGRWRGAGRSGKVSPCATRAVRTCRATRVSTSRAIRDTPPRAAIRVGVSRKMGAMAAGFFAHCKLSAAAGCPLEARSRSASERA
jgi:hypothetical protein